jgi:O-antigen ligase
MILVCGLIIFWDWLELRKLRSQMPPGREKRKMWFDLNLRLGLLLIGGYLLNMCDSKTSMTCLALGGGMIAIARLPVFQQRVRLLGVLSAVVFGGYFVLNQMFDIKGALLHDLGRNATLTGRTDVWRVLLNIGTDPFIGTGFLSFWDDPAFRSKLPYWVAFSAHNGYIEMYLCGGAVGIFFLVIMILAIGFRTNRALGSDGDYGVVRFSIYVIALIANYTESNFAEMTPIGFLFLTAAIGHAEAALMLRQANKPVVDVPERGEPDIHVASRSAFSQN